MLDRLAQPRELLLSQVAMDCGPRVRDVDAAIVFTLDRGWVGELRAPVRAELVMVAVPV